MTLTQHCDKPACQHNATYHVRDRGTHKGHKHSEFACGRHLPRAIRRIVLSTGDEHVDVEARYDGDWLNG